MMMEGENSIFKINLIQKLIPELNDKFSREDKIEYTLDEIKDILRVRYGLDDLYKKLKSKLTNTEIGVSIKRSSNRFTFFKKSNELKRESDYFEIQFKKDFIPIVINHLLNNDTYKITEIEIKNIMNCNDYNTINLHTKLRKILSGTDIEISISRRDIQNKFIFYYKSKHLQIKKEEIEEKRNYEKFLTERENKQKIEEETTRKESINKDFDIMKSIVLKNTKGVFHEFDCEMCKNKVKLKYPEISCPICGNRLVEKWK